MCGFIPFCSADQLRPYAEPGGQHQLAMAAKCVPISEEIANDKVKLAAEAVKHVRAH
jgi:hypothetical protein